MTADLIAFYSGTGTDHRGRRIAEIWEWPDEELERTHDYIQWLFPLREKSGFNVNAPMLDDSTLARFRERPGLKLNLRRSLERMLAFYGLETRESGIVAPIGIDSTVDDQEPEYNERLRAWVTYGNHNHLRITRILKSLNELGLKEEADAMFQCLMEMYRTEKTKEFPGISEETFQFWRKAIE